MTTKDIEVSQEYNDNVNNPNTELCFDCKTYKHIDNFTNLDGKHICNQCYSVYQRLCNKKDISFNEVEGRKGMTMGMNQYLITDVYGIIANKKYHIGGYNPTIKDFNFPAQNKASIFRRKMQFLYSSGKYICFYCHTGNHNPLDFINKIKEMDDNFGINYDCEIKKCGDYWEFHGNLEQVSCAFSFRIFSKKYLNIIIDMLSNPYYKNITINI